MAKPKRRWWLRILIGVGLFLVTGVIGVGIRMWFFVDGMDRDSRQLWSDTIALLDETEPGWRFEDLERKRPAIRDEENGARVIMEAVALMPKGWPAYEAPPRSGDPGVPTAEEWHAWGQPLNRLPPEIPLDKKFQTVLRTELARVTEAMAKTKELSRFTKGRFPIQYQLDYTTTMLPDVQGARLAVKALVCDALINIEEHRLSDAWADASRMLVAARIAGDEPIFICQLIWYSCEQQAMLACERILTRGQVSEDELALMQQNLAVESHAIGKALLQTSMMERALFFRLWDAIECGELDFATVMNSLVGDPMTTTSIGKRLMLPRLREMATFCIDDYSALISAHRTEDELERESFLEELMLIAHRNTQRIFSGLLVSSAVKVTEATRRTTAIIRCSIAAIAAERYRLQNGKWPNSFDELVPAFLDTPPLDPFDPDGNRIRLKQKPDGILFYSIGKDKEDNDGKLDRDRPQLPGVDWGFQLWNPEARKRDEAKPK